MEKEKSNDKRLIEIPSEHISNASGFNEINTTPPAGDRGVVEELEKALKEVRER